MEVRSCDHRLKPPPPGGQFSVAVDTCREAGSTHVSNYCAVDTSSFKRSSSHQAATQTSSVNVLRQLETSCKPAAPREV